MRIVYHYSGWLAFAPVLITNTDDFEVAPRSHSLIGEWLLDAAYFAERIRIAIMSVFGEEPAFLYYRVKKLENAIVRTYPDA